MPVAREQTNEINCEADLHIGGELSRGWGARIFVDKNNKHQLPIESLHYFQARLFTMQEMKATIEKAVAIYLVVWTIDMLAIPLYYGLYKAWWLGGVEA
jgi:hypothetical protein